jgi:hypothetical protein
MRILMEMKWQISWPNRKRTIQLVASPWKFQEISQGLDNQRPQEGLGKDTHLYRVPWQQNKGAVKTKQEQLRWVVCLLRGHLSKLGLTRWLEKEKSATLILYDVRQ